VQQFWAIDIVLAAKYDQNWGWLGFFNVLLMKSHIVYVHASHVKAIKFPMVPLDHKV
jgi:hypothetical protein